MIRPAQRAALAGALLAAAACGDVKSNKPDVGVKVGPLGGPTTEDGGQVAFVVTLRTQPKSDVIIPISSSDTSEGILGSAGELVFTRDNWQSPHAVTVTGVDDPYADGHASYEIVFGAIQSADANYNGLQIASIPATNLDDDVAGVVVSPSSGPTTEAGGESEFTLTLSAKPEGIVSIPYASSDETEGQVAGQSVEFDGDDWNLPKTVTVTGIDDATPDGNQGFAIALGPIFSTDPNWDGIELSPMLLVNVDDDSPGITVSAASGPTTEVGGVATFSVFLNSQPSANVVVSLDTDDATEGAVDMNTLTFTTANFATPQMVTVTGANDDAADGAIAYQVDFQAAVSLDMAYDGLVPASVDLINTDDENAAVTVSPANGLTTESGGSSMFDVVLAAEPANDVTLEITVSNSKEATVTPSAITFTAANWDVPVQVTVTGKNDFLDDGHKNYQLILTATGDATYSALASTFAFLTNVDDGVPANVVVYNDNFGTLADEAATALAMNVTVVSTQTALLTELAANPTVVIWEASSGAALDPGMEPGLTAWLSSGGRLIYSDTDLDGQPGMQALLEVTAANPFDGFRSVSSTSTLRGDIFIRNETVPPPLTGVNVVAGDNGVELTLVSATNGTIAAVYVANTSGAMAITNGNAVIVSGFAPDDAVGTNNDGDGKPDVQELYENQLLYLLDVPRKEIRADFVGAAPITDFTTTEVPLTVTFDEVIAKVIVSFHITHTFDGDLDIHLVDPAGNAYELATDLGGGGNNFGTACSPDSARTTFDDDATASIATGAVPFAGTWRPEGTGLGGLVGTSSAGTWKLRVVDQAAGDSGTVNCWSLRIPVEDN